MTSKEILVHNASGLHARPAANFISIAKGFKSKITVKKGDKVVNGKSIVALLSAAIVANSLVVISADGPDEDAAVQALVSAVESGLGE